MLLRFWRQYFFQSAGQRFQARCTKAAKLPLMDFLHRPVKLAKNLKAIGGDASLDDAAVIALAFADNHAALFHAVEETCHVRVVGDHAITDAFAGEAGGLGSAKDAKDIVLGAGQSVFLHELFGLLSEAFGGFEQSDKNSGFKGNGALRSFGSHNGNIVVITTIVNTGPESFFVTAWLLGASVFR